MINANNKNKSFEIFGYDFMIDYDLKVWLIEINSNPSITTGGKVLDAYVPRMIDDAFKLTIDKIFPPPGNRKTEGRIDDADRADQRPVAVYPMEGYRDDENLWQPLFD